MDSKVVFYFGNALTITGISFILQRQASSLSIHPSPQRGRKKNKTMACLAYTPTKKLKKPRFITWSNKEATHPFSWGYTQNVPTLGVFISPKPSILLKIDFRAVLGLQKNWTASTEFWNTPFPQTQFPLWFRPYISMVHLLQLCIIINTLVSTVHFRSHSVLLGPMGFDI